MIVDLLVGAVLLFFNVMLALLPDFEMEWPDFGFISLMAGPVNDYAPVGELFVCIGVMMAFRAFIMIWGFMVFVYRILPFKAS